MQTYKELDTKVIKDQTCCILVIISWIILSDLSTISLGLKYKVHKSLEYCCLVLHLTSVSKICYAESNSGIFILIAPLAITNTTCIYTRTNVLYCEWFVCQHSAIPKPYCERFVNNTISPLHFQRPYIARILLFSNTFDIRKYNFLGWIERWYFYPYCAIRNYKYKDKLHLIDLDG
jgi:hypothetical protein